MSLGTANIDHVILSGAGWLVIDAKVTAAGTLTTDDRGRGVLVEENGTHRPEPWLDSTKMHSTAGILVRLTGLRGCAVWVTPEATSHQPGRPESPCLQVRRDDLLIGEAAAGDLAALLPVPQPPADPDSVAALARYVANV